MKNTVCALVLAFGLSACSIQSPKHSNDKAAGMPAPERLEALEQDCNQEVSKLALYTGMARLQDMHRICTAISE